MRVAFCVGELRLDGIAIYCARLAAALPCEVVLVTSGVADAGLGPPARAALARLLEPFDAVAVREGPLGARSVANVLGLARLLRERGVSIAHVHELSLLGAVGPAARLAGAAVAGTSHLGAAGSDAWNAGAKRLFALGLGRVLCDRYFAISSEIEREYRARYRIPVRRITKVLSGVDLERFRPAAPAERARAPRAPAAGRRRGGAADRPPRRRQASGRHPRGLRADRA